MERPNFSEENINQQNNLYSMDVVEKYREKPKTATTTLDAISEAFILGAGGYEGSFDAALVLQSGGLTVLVDHLRLADIRYNPQAEIETARFEQAVRAAVDYGAQWDLFEEEIPTDAVSDSDPDIGLFGPLTDRFI